MRKLSTLFWIFLLVASMLIPTFAATAEDNTISPRYSYLKTTGVGLSIDENTGIANCHASCVSLPGYTVEVECKLQRYAGSFWGTIKTWTDTGTQIATTDNNWAVYSGSTYRVYATFRVYNSAGSLLESVTDTDTYSYY